MPKAIAVQAVFMIAVIAIFLFFLVGIFSQWTGITKSTVNEAACTSAKIGCCSALISGAKKTCEWDSGCSQYKIEQPDITSCCKEGFRSIRCPK
ncbi:MAG: hypothetical protein AABW61_01950 [Candidatus Aenigmatarchaeota archaeon]